MLTMARCPLGIASSSLTAWLMMRAPVAPKGMAERRAAAIGIEAVPWKGAEIARHLGPIAQEGRVLQGFQVERHLCREGLVDLPEVDIVVA